MVGAKNFHRRTSGAIALDWMPDFLSSFSVLPLEQLHALIALAGLGVAGLAVYAVLAAIKELRRR